MEIATKSFVIAITAVLMAAIMLLAFVWAGPGLAGITSPASASALFNEELVQEIYDRVSPAVVEVKVDSRSGDAFVGFGSGSGFLIDPEGHIATSNHVVAGADRVRVVFQDGISVEAEVLGRNRSHDLALLKVDSATVAGIEPVVLGDSSLVRPGQMAIAIGSPFGLKNSITTGVISGVDRDLRSDLGRTIPRVLQTDALISPGSSGGPLLNSVGQVVGINTAMQITPTGFTRGNIGFAVPINTLSESLAQLKEGQDVRPPWLGIGAITLEPLLVERLDLPVDQGVYITRVQPDSPADQARLVASETESRRQLAAGGDIVIAVEGITVSTVPALIAELNRYQSGDQITLTVVRVGSEVEVLVTLSEWPEAEEVRIQRHISPWREPREHGIPRHPRIPFIPGLPFPRLFPDSPQK